MKWILLAIGLLVVIVAVACAIGAMLPARHKASRAGSVPASPEAVYAVLAGPPDWRTGVKSFGVLPDVDGKKRWWEADDYGKKITYELVEAAPPHRMVTRIADDGLPFGGTWTFELRPAETGGTDVRIIEDGVIHNVIFRFMARFFFGYERTMDEFLRDLRVKFGG